MPLHQGVLAFTIDKIYWFGDQFGDRGAEMGQMGHN